MFETKIPRISIAACRVNAKMNQREFADKIGIGLNSKTGGDEHGNSRRSKRKL